MCWTIPFIGAIKLVHRSGYVSGASSVSSNWGSDAGDTSLVTIVTDAKNEIISPPPRLVTVDSRG